MGILDDAIREHLELRRRNGADGDEVMRLERSLLSDGEDAGVTEPALEAPASAPVEDEPAAVEPAAAPEPVAEPEPDPPFELAPIEQPTRQFTAAEVEAAEEPHAGEPKPAPPVEAAEPGEHDELEDTPDFLQETPEHDRLWFEQKPPKDFDF